MSTRVEPNPHVAANNARNLPRREPPQSLAAIERLATQDRRHLYTTSDDMERINALRMKLQAGSNPEAVRRAVVSMLSLLEFTQDGGEVVLCRPGQAEKVVWFL